MKFRHFLLSILAVMVASTAFSQSSITIIHSGDLVIGISKNGKYVVGFHQASLSGWIWSAASGQVDFPRAFAPQGVADNGTAVGLLDDSNGATTAAYCPLNGSPVSIGTLPGDDHSAAFSVSSDGSVIVGDSGSSTRSSAFRWSAVTGMSEIARGTEKSGKNAAAIDVSVDGNTIVGRVEGVPFRWTLLGGTVKPSPFSGEYVHVTSDGSVASGDVADPFFAEGVIQTGSTALYLGSNPFSQTFRAYAVDDLRYAVVSVGPANFHLWRPVQGLQSLRDYLVATGASAASSFSFIRSAYPSADGSVIAGTAEDANGVDSAFYASVSILSPAQPLLQQLTAAPTPRAGGGGNTVSVMARMSLPASHGGVHLPLTSSSAKLVPAPTALLGGDPGIFIPAGASIGKNSTATGAVSSSKLECIRGTYLGYSLIAPVQLLPAKLYDPTLSSLTAKGGTTVTGTLTLNGGIATSSVQIALQSTNSAAASVASAANITRPNISTTFTVQTHPVSVPTIVTIKATYRGVSKSVNLTVLP